MTDLSIIVVSWNTKGLLADCLDSVYRNAVGLAGYEVETIVVDNASTDGSIEMLRADYPWVQLVENADNVGFAAANNQGIAQSVGRYVLLLNPDTVMLPEAMSALLSYMDNQPDVGVAGSRLLNADGSLQMSCYPFPTLFRELWRLLHLDYLFYIAEYPVHKWPLDRPREVDVVQGASLAVRREVIERVGSLDEGYFMYSEETDWCYRIKQAGWQIHWLPSSQVVHFGGQSTRQVATAMFLQLYQSKLRYFRKHFGGRTGLVYKFILLLTSLIRLTLTPVGLLLRPGRQHEQLALAGCYLELVRALPGL